MHDITAWSITNVFHSFHYVHDLTVILSTDMYVCSMGMASPNSCLDVFEHSFTHIPVFEKIYFIRYCNRQTDDDITESVLKLLTRMD